MAVHLDPGNLNDGHCFESGLNDLPQNFCKEAPELVIADTGYHKKPCHEKAQSKNYLLVTPVKKKSLKQQSTFEKKVLQYRVTGSIVNRLQAPKHFIKFSFLLNG